MRSRSERQPVPQPSLHSTRCLAGPNSNRTNAPAARILCASSPLAPGDVCGALSLNPAGAGHLRLNATTSLYRGGMSSGKPRAFSH